jgi:hypothetical protein
MCCFSQPVQLVGNTQIFSRGVNGRQILVYSMTYAAAGDLAMVLPLPVPPSPGDDAVRFINLEGYARFFLDLQSGFVMRSRSLSKGVVMGAETLKVHDVGSFEASFVPTLADFDRLDERFRIPGDAWDRIPAYRDFGFAVFMLKGGPQPKDVHPMALEFPRRDPELLYFPTVHIHDRRVHPYARFDHMLFCQAGGEMAESLAGWTQSHWKASGFVDIGRAAGLVDPEAFVWQTPLSGKRENKDALLGAGGELPRKKAGWW